MRIPQKDIDAILDATNIEEVLREYIPNLQRSGSRWKACCPFHNEKTPSFMITPSKNIYKCFSCGESGNAVTFLMKHEGKSFVEAMEILSKRAGMTLHVIDTPMTAEEIKEQKEREAALLVTREAASFFVEKIKSDSPDCVAAREYAEKRWGKKHVDEAGIGYAPGHGALLAWATGKGLDIELLISLGLLRRNEKGRVSDGFFGRVMMPIKSRSNQILGFIGRVLGDAEPKYMNTPECGIFKKGDTVFGLDIAARTAASTGVIYMVEGAPDVYRMQINGTPNTVASLGTAWSEVQFSQLSRYNANLCFIPDIDPPREGEDYGPGIKAVMKNGRRAIEAGFNVIVKEITPPNQEEKADVDSYIRSKEILESLPNVDFIPWYTSKQLRGGESSVERAEVMRDVCGMLAAIKDKSYLDMMVKQVARLLKITVGTLTGAINEQVKTNVVKKAASGEKMMDRELYSRYGFYEHKNCYYSLNKDGIETCWSNFVMIPLFHIKDQCNSKRLYKITNDTGRKELIEFKQEDLVSLQRFRTRLESVGNYIWEAKEEQLIKLKRFLYEQTDTAEEISQLGWQPDGFFAFGNGVVVGKEWIEADEFGIVRLGDKGNFYLPAASRIYRNERKLYQFERRFVHLSHSTISFRTYTDKLAEVFGDHGKVGLCFFLATLFKDIVVRKTKNFPILNLFGPKGSGKSELGHSLMSFFVVNNEPPNLSAATDAALADTVAQCANALVHIDEYKNTIELSRREFIKGLYDGVGRTRMNMDRDKKKETTAVDCGVILSGQEMPTIDIAIFSRMIYLPFSVTEFDESRKRRFEELKSMRDLGCSHMVVELLRYRKKMESDFEANYRETISDLLEELGEDSGEDRIFRNWVSPVAVYRTLSGVLDVSFGYRELLKIAAAGIRRQNEECKTSNELGVFWGIVDYLHQNGEIFIDADYRIKSETEFRGKGQKEKTEFRRPRLVLYMCTKRIFKLYRQKGRATGDPTIAEASLRHYLEVSKEFLGTKNAVRFKNMSNQAEALQRTEGSVGVIQTTRVDWALCFDYEQLVRNYGINLQIETARDEAAVDPIDIDENDQTIPF